MQQTDKHHVCSTLFGSTEVSIANCCHRRCHKVELINVDGHVLLHRVTISIQRYEACLSCAEENVHASHQMQEEKHEKHDLHNLPDIVDLSVLLWKIVHQ